MDLISYSSIKDSIFSLVLNLASLGKTELLRLEFSYRQDHISSGKLLGKVMMNSVKILTKSSVWT